MWEVEVVKYTHACLKLGRIKLETWNFARKYTHKCSFKNYISQYQDPLNSADASIFWQKFTIFGKNSIFTQNNSVRAVLRFSGFVRWKITINENVSFTDYASGIWLPDCSILTINRKNDNDATICRHGVIMKLFLRSLVSLVRFSYWSIFNVNILTSSGVMTIFFNKWLTRNPEIENTPVWV